MTQLSKTKRTEVKRMKERASYEQAAIYAAIDEAMVATIAFQDGENTFAIPTAIWRKENYLYIHGSNGSRLLKNLQSGTQACVSIFNIHGLVLARSAFHHSINYSSVCIYGCFEVVNSAAKNQHMQNFFDRWLPQRWPHVRQPDANELAATTILRLSLTEAVLKSRQGPPKDDDIDMSQKVWAGVVPIKLQQQKSEQVAEQNDDDLPGKIG